VLNFLESDDSDTVQRDESQAFFNHLASTVAAAVFGDTEISEVGCFQWLHSSNAPSVTICLVMHTAPFSQFFFLFLKKVIGSKTSLSLFFFLSQSFFFKIHLLLPSTVCCIHPPSADPPSVAQRSIPSVEKRVSLLTESFALEYPY
jgi:hypothetical protein